jgi:hypothetical protein
MSKTHLLGLTVSVALAIVAGCTSSSGEDSVDESNVTARKLDDAVAKSILAGGCSVVVDGSPTKTSGTGGACPTKLSAILDLIKKQDESSMVFAVSEKGDLPDDPDTTYRFVVQGQIDEQLVFVSAFGTKDLSEDGAEAMGFSPSLQAFAYYKVEGGRWVRKGDATQVKSNTDGTDRPFECISCHTTGAPLMKELHDSWGNWQSNWFSLSEVKGGSKVFKRLFEETTIADDLEGFIIQGTRLTSKGRVARATKEGELRGLLTQLMCEVGEPTLLGNHEQSGTRLGEVSADVSSVRPSILLSPIFDDPHSIHLLEDMSLEYKLDKFGAGAAWGNLDTLAYRQALKDNGQTIGGRPGDTIFPLSSPDKSFADQSIIGELLEQKLVDKDIVGDVLMTDFTVSSFSRVRCELAQTIPKTWKTPDELKSEWAKSLGASNLRGAKGLKARLEDKNDKAKHEAAIDAWAAQCEKRPPADLTKDIVKIISQRRVEFTQRYRNVIESPWLVPEDKLDSKPGAIRLSGTTCEIEPAGSKFIGEE